MAKNNLIGKVNNSLYSICILKLSQPELKKVRDVIFTSENLQREDAKEFQYDTMLSALHKKMLNT